MKSEKKYNISFFALLGFIIAITLAFSSLYGCNSSGCVDNQSSIPLAGFYDTRAQAITIDSMQINGIGAPDDSILYTLKQQLSEVYLPLRATGEPVQYRFYYAPLDICDTVTFDYDAFPYFASEECGAMYRFRIRKISYTTYLLDSIGMSDSLITNSPTQQLKFFFRTSSPQ